MLIYYTPPGIADEALMLDLYPNNYSVTLNLEKEPHMVVMMHFNPNDDAKRLYQNAMKEIYGPKQKLNLHNDTLQVYAPNDGDNPMFGTHTIVLHLPTEASIEDSR